MCDGWGNGAVAEGNVWVGLFGSFQLQAWKLPRKQDSKGSYVVCPPTQSADLNRLGSNHTSASVE